MKGILKHMTHCWVLKIRATDLLGPFSADHQDYLAGVGSKGNCPNFENCIVDASILINSCLLEISNFCGKLLRAHGGCLGIRSR